MRVGIDVRALGTASGGRGVGTYIRGLVEGLAEVISPRDEILLFRHRDDPPTGIGGPFAQIELTRPRRLITAWDQIAWKPLLRKLRLDVFHSPFYAIPLLHPRDCSIVQTIYDLTPLLHPYSVSPTNRIIFQINFRLARLADRIITPSKATAADVVRHLGIDPARITVVPAGIDVSPGQAESIRRGAEEVRRRLGIDQPYVIHAGGHDPIKNLPAVIKSLALIAPRHPELRLVITGAKGLPAAALEAAAVELGVAGRVIFTGFVPRGDLLALYAGAAALVYPSLAEGFGLPVLDAMACGVPVVGSRAGAISEVSGECCLLVDPASVGEIAAALDRVLTDEKLVSDLVRAGKERVTHFSWRETARVTIDVYRQLAE